MLTPCTYEILDTIFIQFIFIFVLLDFRNFLLCSIKVLQVNSSGIFANLSEKALLQPSPLAITTNVLNVVLLALNYLFHTFCKPFQFHYFITILWLPNLYWSRFCLSLLLAFSFHYYKIWATDGFSHITTLWLSTKL